MFKCSNYRLSRLAAFLFLSALTAAGAVVFAVLLRVTFQSTLETMLPELQEPRVSVVVLRTEFKVVLIEPFHIS